jgi:hypothetical protein
LNEHVPSTEVRFWREGGRHIDEDASPHTEGALQAPDNIAQDERQDGKESRDQGVLDQVLAPLVTHERTRNCPQDVLLAAQFSTVCQEVFQSVCHRPGGDAMRQNVRDYQISGTIVRVCPGKSARFCQTRTKPFFQAESGFLRGDGLLLSWRQTDV